VCEWNAELEPHRIWLTLFDKRVERDHDSLLTLAATTAVTITIIVAVVARRGVSDVVRHPMLEPRRKQRGTSRDWRHGEV
jgi:hypothetical protein